MAATAVHSHVPTDLQTGIAALRSVEDAEVTGQVEWDSEARRWLLPVRLKPRDLALNEFVPAETEWYISIDALYPFGEIEFFPAKENGIIRTFPHQSLNRESKNELYRNGKVCLSDPFAIFGDRFLSEESFTASERLPWLVNRAVLWLGSASRNELLTVGHYFELPDFPKGSTDYAVVAFSETPETILKWREITDRMGYFEYCNSTHNPSIVVVKQILRSNLKPLYGTSFGTHINSFPVSKKVGIWIFLASMPVVPPWQAPLTWGDLEECCRQQGVDLRASLDTLYSSKVGTKRIGKIAMIGFPVPNKVGENADRIHWLAIQLPELFNGASQVNGFRPSKASARRANNIRLHAANAIDWIPSENWGLDQINSRGKLPSSILDKKVLLVGGGALGSIIAELFVRGGLYDLTVCDGDDVGAGNLVRHTLDLRHIELNKARSLTHHLNQISPWAKVRYLHGNFPNESDAGIDGYDLIVDCTASQKALCALAVCYSTREHFFASFSISFGAKRLYSFVSLGRRFPFEEYRKAIIPWMNGDATENHAIIPPREGIGCWHPVFPARADEMWMWGSMAIKVLIRALENTNQTFRVHEQRNSEGLAEIHEITERR